MTAKRSLSRPIAALFLLAGCALPLTAQPVLARDAPQSEEFVPVDSRSGTFLAAQVATQVGDLDRAIRYLRQSLSFDPQDSNIRNSLMMTLLGRGDVDKAIVEAERLKSVPQSERFARLTLAVGAMRGKNYKQVRTVLADSAQQDDLETLTDNVLISWAKAADGDPAGAVADLEALDRQAWYKPFTLLHAALISDLHGLPDADRLYRDLMDDEEAKAAAPDLWVQGATAYATWLIRNGRADFAESVLSAGEALAPQFIAFAAIRDSLEEGTRPPRFVSSDREGAATYLYGLALVLNRPGAEPLTRVYLQLARALAPQNGTVLVQLGLTEERLDYPRRAIEYYKMVPEGDPLRFIANLQAGLALADNERYEEAEQSLRNAIESRPDEARAYLSLADVYMNAEDYAAAAGTLETAVDRLSAAGEEIDWTFYYRRGMAYERLKQWEKAEPQFRQALELEPDRPEVLNYLGYSLVDRNEKLDEGLELIRKAVEARPEAGFIVDSLGWAYYRLGRFDEAVEELERAITLMPEDPTVNDHLGDAYWRVGRRLEARYQWNTALAAVKAMDSPDAELMGEIMKKQAQGLPPVDEERPESAEAEAGETPPTAN